MKKRRTESLRGALALLLTLLCLLSPLVSCGKGENVPPQDGGKETEQVEGGEETPAEPAEPSPIHFNLQAFDGPQSIHTDAQKAVLSGEVSLPSSTVKGTSEQSYPVSISFFWSYTMDPGDTRVPERFVFYLSESPDMKDEVSYFATFSRANVSNLKVGTVYYWQVEALIDGKAYRSEVSSMVTAADGPRNLKVDGITNVRDLGGYTTYNGGHADGVVRQGMIFRTGRLNQNKSTEKQITEKGIATMLDTLGMKSEIDLRRTSDNEAGVKSSPLGSTVKYYSCPFSGRSGCFSEDAMIRNVFKILADENNYPVFFHCSIGTDRTGMIAFLVEGLLGVSRKDLYNDYLFSNFGNIGSSRNTDDIDRYMKAINETDGWSLSEKFYNYLREIGIPAATLDSVIRILKEDAEK